MRKYPTAIIMDIDGVLANSYHPDFKEQFAKGDFSVFERGIPNYPAFSWAIALVQALSKDHRILFVTARNEDYRDSTIDWLHRNIPSQTIYGCDLYMRKTGDTREDSEIKRELFAKFSTRYNILFAVDDNWNNCRLWESLGIPALTNKIPKE